MSTKTDGKITDKMRLKCFFSGGVSVVNFEEKYWIMGECDGYGSHGVIEGQFDGKGMSIHMTPRHAIDAAIRASRRRKA